MEDAADLLELMTHKTTSSMTPTCSEQLKCRLRVWKRLSKYAQRGFQITVVEKDGGRFVMGPTS